MIAGLLRVFIKLAVLAAIVLLSLETLGSYLKEQVPAPYHRAAWQTGSFIFLACCLLTLLIPISSPAARRRIENLLIAGAAVGAILFVLFISDVDCTRSGRSMSCQLVGEPD